MVANDTCDVNTAVFYPDDNEDCEVVCLLDQDLLLYQWLISMHN